MAWLRHKHLFIVMAVAAAVRLVYWLYFSTSPLLGFLNADQIYYYNWALSLSRGDCPVEGTFEQGPLYAYLLAGAFLAGLPDAVILLVQLGSGVVVAALVYLCGRRLFGEGTAFLGGIITALYGPLVYYECMMMKSFLSPLLTMVVLYAGLRYVDNGRLGWVGVMGIAVGLACLINESHVLLLIPAGILVILPPLPWGKLLACQPGKPAACTTKMHRRLGQLTLLLAAFFLMLVPSVVRNYLATGELVLVTTGGGEVMYIAYGPNANGYWNHGPFNAKPTWREHRDYYDEAQRRAGRPLSRSEASRFWYAAAFAEAVSRPGRTCLLVLARALILFNDQEVPDSTNYVVFREFIPLMYVLPTFGCVFGLGVIGMAASFVLANSKRATLFALGLIAAHVLTVLLTYNFGRFRIGMMPVWNLFAAAGLAGLATAWRQRRWQAWLGFMALVALTVVAFLPVSSFNHNAFRDMVIDKWRVRLDIADLRDRLARNPRDADAHSRLAAELHKAGYIDDCLAHHREAVKLNPQSAAIRLRYANDLFFLGFEEQAADEALVAMQLDASGSAVQANTLVVEMLWHPIPQRRQAAKALLLAERICAATERRDPRMLDTLVAAQAEVGRFDDAVQTAEHAAQLAHERGEHGLVRQIRELQSLYKQGQTVSRLR